MPARNAKPAVSVKSNQIRDQIATSLAVGIHKKESYKAYTLNSWVANTATDSSVTANWWNLAGRWD